MTPVVMKFGGTSVATIGKMQKAARFIRQAVDDNTPVIAVVSAMAGETNRLAELVRSVSSVFDAREYDNVLATGENVTSALLALILQTMGVSARSWQGWQVPVRTSSVHGAARILDIERDRLDARFADGMEVAVIAGFQGVSSDGRITTLGRGGSDLTAVAFAAAFDRARCMIYTDVDGVFTADPRVVKTARKLEHISYEEMLELASLGSKVLQTRSVELAMRHRVPVHVLSSYTGQPGTYVTDEETHMETRTISGIAHSRDEAKVTLQSVADRPGIAALIFTALANHDINVDMIVQNIAEDKRTDITFSCPVEDIAKARSAIELLQGRGDLNVAGLLCDESVCKVSVVGIGMRTQSGIAAKMFAALGREGINIKVISTSEIKISVLVDRKYMELAVRTLHEEFGLHQK
ncbi:MAG: aspartate kinase [Rhodobacteraceae bacterium]|nr:aspartate kinase [Paracoccaceae bacterium]